MSDLSAPVPPSAPVPGGPAPSSTRVKDRSRLVPLIVGLAYLAFWQVVPRIHTDSSPAILLSTIVSLALLVWFPAQIARTFRTPPALLANLVVSAVLIVPLRAASAFGSVPAPWSYLLLLDRLYVPGLGGLLFIWFAASLGSLLSLLLRGANMIPPVAVVLALVDIWTVLLGGPVQRTMQSDTPAARRIMAAMTVRQPAPQQGPGASPIHLDVGFADFLFIAFFAAAIGRFVPGRRAYVRTVVGLVAVLCAYMLIVFVRAWSLPALVPMAAVVLALHWRQFRYTRSEAFALLYAGLFIAAIVGAFWLMASRQSSPGADRPGPAAPEPLG